MRVALALIAALLPISAEAATYADVDSSNLVTNLFIWDGVTPLTPASGHRFVAYAAPAAIGCTWTGTIFNSCPVPTPAVPTPNSLSAIPTSGPGAGVCIEAYVPARLTSPPGTTGTCSEIQMCGTSSTYTIISTNVGNGC